MMNNTITSLLILSLMIIKVGFSHELNANKVKSHMKLAMAQMLVEGGNKKDNLERASQRITAAAKNGADLILLPEILDLGWTHSSAKTEAEPIPGGSIYESLALAARKNNIYVCAGITEKEKDKVYNSAVLINRKGELLLKHRKVHELDIAHDVYSQGTGINTCETEFGTIGLLICADASAKDYVLTRAMGYLGADMILLPSSWAVPPDFDNAKTPYGDSWRKAFGSVCNEFNLTIASVSNVGEISDGPWKDWQCIGNSLFYGNEAEVINTLPHGEKADTIVYQKVVLVERPARGTSWNTYWKSEKKEK